MPRLTDLPNELLYRITSYLDQPAAARLRLVCRAVSEAAKDKVYSSIVLRPVDESATNFLHILNTTDLARRVRSCDIYTCAREEEDGVNQDEKFLSGAWNACFTRFPNFKNLAAVSLVFSPKCTSPETDGWEYPESTEFRTRLLGQFFELLNSEMAHDIKEVSIINLQNLNDESITSSDNFQEVLARVRSLKIYIATEQDEPSPEYTLHKSEFQIFMDELPSTWLQPISSHITVLSLAQDEPFGYLPKLDLRSIHFPHLASLHIGNWTFTHDWQLEWLISHHITLHSLFLLDCSIIYHILPNDPVDSEGYYTFPYDAENDSVETAEFRYTKRWHDFFDRFRTELPHLHHFRIGTQPGFAARSERELPVYLARTRYMAFRGGGMPTPWIEGPQPWNTTRIKEYEELDDAPECDELDRSALERLLTKIGQAKVPSQKGTMEVPGMRWAYHYTVENWMGR
ncbi:hypothetical protein BCR34DRAFT_492855 [Clohesyomyces aquaticus]|uniref:F-box domain-containing protein n=1 Tax=Clohesyomyces aquaticus TaxID=1231657 RepID=A0A1Y1YXU7_9PLEO|nr:hypothetical protein BCR34DRAFT_492855 [Clohesyomyces aquaticus]